MDKKLYVELPPFTGRNVPIAEISKAIGKDAHFSIRTVITEFTGIFHFHCNAEFKNPLLYCKSDIVCIFSDCL